MRFILACRCGHQEECRAEEQRAGSVYRCGNCRKVWGCVRSRRGVLCWVEIEEEDIEFYGLLEEEPVDVLRIDKVDDPSLGPPLKDGMIDGAMRRIGKPAMTPTLDTTETSVAEAAMQETKSHAV